MRAWLNVGEAAEYAGVCKDTIYTACERNELRHVRIGGRRCIRLRPVWLDEWFEEGTRKAAAGLDARQHAVELLGSPQR